MKSQNKRVLRIPTLLDVGLPPDPDALLEWLNNPRRSRHHHVLNEMFSRIRQIATRKGAMFEAVREGKSSGTASTEVVRVVDEMNRMLRAYTVFPQFGPIAEHFWPVVWMPTRAGPMDGWVKTRRRGAAIQAIAASNAILTFLGLLRNGQLNRVRQCEGCAAWFYAKPSHKRFHSITCQQRQFHSTDSFKQYWSRYMRNYRRDEKKRADNALVKARRLPST